MGNSCPVCKVVIGANALFVPAVIKLSSLEKFLFSSSANQNGWAKSLYLLGNSLNTVEGVQVAGVAPDFQDWYVCFYIAHQTEAQVLTTVRKALLKVGAGRSRVAVVAKAREFGRKSGHRRAILRIQPDHAEPLARHVRRTAPSPNAESALDRVRIAI